MIYQVERKQIIMMGTRSLHFKIEADSPEEAENKAKEMSEIDAYSVDVNIEQTEDLEFITEED